ncbi:hypothetical protein D1BOALGB6SA_724 [Olavius sp. associated proteobacterium Delta 1]|nr:hypothetical protein D1BOALGB6SA_724 [Olavius sp. associated proteobacterium Delta 1]
MPATPLNNPHPPTNKKRKPHVYFNGAGGHANCSGQIGMIFCIVF